MLEQLVPFYPNEQTCARKRCMGLAGSQSEMRACRDEIYLLLGVTNLPVVEPTCALHRVDALEDVLELVESRHLLQQQKLALEHLGLARPRRHRPRLRGHLPAPERSSTVQAKGPRVGRMRRPLYAEDEGMNKGGLCGIWWN